MEYDVHFQLNSYMRITAKSKEEARQLTNDIIERNRPSIERLLHVGLEDEDYTTDVLEATE